MSGYDSIGYKLRDSLWEYPRTVSLGYKAIKRFRGPILFLLISLILIGLYIGSYSLIVSKTAGASTLYLGIVAQDAGYNPIDHTNLAQTINKLVFNTLVTVDENNVPHPSIASSWVTDTNLTSLTFTLRPDIYWADGRNLTTDDVIYSFSLQNKLNPGGAYSLMNMKKINKRTFQITLANIDVNIWEHMLWPILPNHIIQATYLESGTGPYVLEKSENGIFYFKANDAYFQGAAHIRSIVLRTFPTQDTLLQAYNEGYINTYFVHDPERSVLEDVQGNPSDFLYKKEIIRGYNGLFFNIAQVSDPNIRKGIAFAIDKSRLQTLLPDQTELVNGPINPNSWAYAANGNIERYAYSISSAMQVFQSSGYTLQNGVLANTAGTQLQLTLAYNKDKTTQSIINEVMGNLAQVGIRIVPQAYTQADWTDQVLVKKNFQLAYIQIQGGIDPDPLGLWGTGEKTNLSQYSNPNVDRALSIARETQDKTRRAEAYVFFQRSLMADSPAVFLYSPDVLFDAKSAIKGIRIDKHIAFDEDVLNTLSEWYF